MPKRPRSCGLGVDHCPPERRHLYLVLDDWLWGYSIRKLDLHQAIAGNISGEGATDAGIDDDTEQAPPPILFRLQAPRGLPRHFAAIGTKILAMHPNGRDLPFFCNSLFPVFDIAELGLIFGPRPKADWVDPIYIPAGGDRLFALACDSFELLSPPPLGEPTNPSVVVVQIAEATL
ncbi:unnamed protein product [Urochloa decumbens]|uniref:Uncharacterized protein n=1 Tax=Urochloa decumbens TaxID=240449 RepID=A0ABC8ZZU5_9POAL